MSDLLVNAVNHHTINHLTRAATSCGPMNHATVQTNALTGLRTKGQAIETIRGMLKSFGMANSSIDKLKRAKMFRSLKLHGRSGAPVTQETRQFIGMLQTLRGNGHASGAQKQHFAQMWLGTRSGAGARKALTWLAQQSTFWKTLDNTQREFIAAKLGQLGSGTKVIGLKSAFANVVGSKFFREARAQGKTQALLQPHRANKLLQRWKSHDVKLPFDVKRCKKEAWHYAKTDSGYKTFEGRVGLQQNLLSVRDRVLFRFFEDMPTHSVYANKSKSYADFFLDGHLKKSSWAQGAHDYLKTRRSQEKCGLFTGRGKECIK